MNTPIPEFISYVPVPTVCDGIILNKVDGSSVYEVSIDRTEKGGFSGPVRAVPIYHAPMDEPSYEPKDRVKLLVVFLFDVNNNRFDSVAQTFQTQILGKYDPENVMDVNIQNPITEKDGDRVVVKNKKSEAGVVMTDNHEVTMTPGGSISHTMKAFGGGITKNCDYTRAQNFHRIISHNDPAYPSREHFGMFTGEDPDDEAARAAPEDSLINYRRFVQQSRDPGFWVSTCEGAFAPWVGANNEGNVVETGKDVLFTRIVNSDKSRITHELGEPGTDFIMMRVDDVISGELTAPTPSGASLATLGNRFKFSVSDAGEVEIYAAGGGTPTVNLAGFKLTINADGNLKVLSKGKIIFTHGDSDEAINSIVMDPSGGVDVTAMSGFRVNGKELLNENFLNWFMQNQATFGVAGPYPVVISVPVALLTPLKIAPDNTVGILTHGLPIPAIGIVQQADTFLTT